MTDGQIALQDLLEKSSDASLLREMIGFAAQRLMALETDALCGAGHGERTSERISQRNGFATVTGRPAPAQSSCGYRSFVKAATSPASLSRAGWPRRR